VDEGVFCFQEAAMSEEGDFLRRSNEMMACYGRGDYTAALEVTERLAAEFPGKVLRTTFWRICLLTRLQKVEAALEAFAHALQAGLWWSETTLRRDPDLQPLQGLPDFECMLAASEELHAAAQESVQPATIVREPAAGTEPPYPLLIALHGQAGTAEADLERWQAACPLGWLVAALQSSQLAWPGAYCWDDRQRAQEQVVNQFEGVCAGYPVDRSRVIVGGFSQGAALAIRLVLNGSLLARGFLSVVPGVIDPQLLTSWASARRDRPVRGYLVAGGLDPRYEFFKQVRATLAEHGIACEMEDHPELAHEFPEKFEISLTQALSFLTA
jgi:predicted esterase